MKSAIIVVNPYAIHAAILKNLMHLGDNSNTSRGIHLRAAFITVVVAHPEAVIQWWLLLRLCGHYVNYSYRFLGCNLPIRL